MSLEQSEVDAVLTHMNDDHADDSLAIVREHGYPAATAAEMTGVDLDGGTWHVTDAIGEASVRITWPGGPVPDRAGLRAAIVALVPGRPDPA
jgi:hypothetical protein